MKILQSWRVEVVLAAVLVVAAQLGPAVHAEATTHRVEIQKFKFVPETLDVRPGDTIVWVNLDVVPHTVSALDKSWDSGNIDYEAEWSTTVTAEMSGSYYCRYHPSMKGALGAGTSQSSKSTMSKSSIAKLAPQ